MARHLTETGYETGRRAGRRTGRIVAIVLIMALTVGGALVVRHLGGVLQSQLSASVSRLTALVTGSRRAWPIRRSRKVPQAQAL